LPAHILEESD